MGARRKVYVTEVVTDRHRHNHRGTTGELYENIDFQ